MQKTKIVYIPGCKSGGRWQAYVGEIRGCTWWGSVRVVFSERKPYPSISNNGGTELTFCRNFTFSNLNEAIDFCREKNSNLPYKGSGFNFY